MNRKTTLPIPEAIVQLQRQLDQFRSTQPRRTKLPESLWQAAVELARQYGIYPVAHPLRLDYMGLKKRLSGVPSRHKTTKPAFVELIAPNATPMEECVIEFDAPSGRKMRIQWKASAPRHLGSRDRYIGWSSEARRRNIRFIAYNTRFLILPWVAVPHLASHILGRMAVILSEDWQQIYCHPVYFAETFIDPGRFRGTCYRAANWQLLGLTTGRGKNDQTNKPNRPIKEVLGLPLTPRFREYLTQL